MLKRSPLSFSRSIPVTVALSVFAVVTAVAGAAPASAAPAGVAAHEMRGAGLHAVVHSTADANQPAQKPDSLVAAKAPTACPAPAEGKSVGCLTVGTSHRVSVSASPNSILASTTVAPIPQWCIDNAYKGVYGLRTGACQVTTLRYTTSTTQNGVTQQTGQLDSNVINYEYSDTGLPDWAHQIEISAYTGWGDALNATIEGSASSNGSCTTGNTTFPAQAVQPLQSWRAGEAFYSTTATAPGAIGNCDTTWNLTYRNGIYTPAGIAYDTNNVRCDNATAGNARVGCVVPWYASALQYSQSANPTLASHVSQAQASGLPGATFAAPLVRTTNPAVITQNRTQACGDAPSIQSLSCDEYPIATSYQGLSAGGTRRTFDGCSFNLPRQTGPAGVSVCMIAATDNNSQGGTNTQFFRGQRMLDGDPFRVLVVA